MKKGRMKIWRKEGRKKEGKREENQKVKDNKSGGKKVIEETRKKTEGIVPFPPNNKETEERK